MYTCFVALFAQTSTSINFVHVSWHIEECYSLQYM